MRNSFHSLIVNGSALLVGSLAVLFALTQANAADTDTKAVKAVAPWAPHKLADGQPDVQGFWGAEIQGTFSLVNPRNGGGSAPTRWDVAKHEGKTGPIRPSRIVDPQDGQVPYQPWARAKQQGIEANIERPTKQEYIDPQARCFPDGVPRNAFWTGFRIQQHPGYVVITYDQNHTYRVIPLDGRPHIPENIKLWMSDSRGHWEGNTLVVDVTNSNAGHRLSNEGDFSSNAVHITERFSFVDANNFNYEARLTDPTVYTKPWTIASKFKRTNKDEPDYEQWEQSCHEGERSAETSFLGDKTDSEKTEPGNRKL